jgi:hypothetical protein
VPAAATTIEHARVVTEMSGYRVRARNTATASTNKIHDDVVARRYGFSGGLVPGVDVYAYMTHPPAEVWGRPWLERGTMNVHLTSPAYDGVELVVEVDEQRDDAGGRTATLVARGPEGDALASGSAGLPLDAPSPFDPADYPHQALPTRRQSASAATLARGVELGAVDATFHSAKASDYLDEIDEQLDLYREGGLAHPGYLLRGANALLVSNFALGPWIHVSSDATHFGVVSDGDRVSTRGRVTDEYERKGHRFVELDVVVIADGSRPVMRAQHTAIYEPRRQGAPPRPATEATEIEAPEQR